MDAGRRRGAGRHPARPTTSPRCAPSQDAGDVMAAHRPARPLRGRRVRHPVRQHRRPRPRPLRRLPRAGRHRPARRVVLPRGRPRGQARGLRRPRRADARPRRLCRRPRRRRGAGHGPRDPHRRRALGQGHQPRPGEDLHARRPRRPRRDGARRRLDPLGRRPRRPAGALEAVVVRQPDHLASVAAALADEPVEGVARLAGLAGRPRPRALPVRRLRRGELRLLRPHPLGRPARCASAGSAGVVPRRGGARRGRRPALRRAALPAARQGADGRARRQPHRGVPASLSSRAVDGRRHPPRGPGQARPVHPQDRLPRAVARLRRPRGRRPTTSSATSAGRSPSRSTATSPSSADPSTATSGS